MPDDCGHLEKRFEATLRNMQMNAGTYMKYTMVCPYCRTNPKKDVCVNCGAPQEIQYSKKTWDEFGNVQTVVPSQEPAKATVVTPEAFGNSLKVRNVGLDPSYWT